MTSASILDPGPAKGALIAFAAALALTLALAAPVVLAPHERLPGSGEILGRGDPNRDALVVIDQFRTGRVPAPYLQPLTDLPGRALARVIGPVAAYNALVLSSFPLAAAAAYLLARHVGGSHAAAVIAAMAYAFLPFHVLQAGGHPHVAETQWLPLYLLALWRCVERPGWRRAAILVAAAAAVGLADFYAGFVAAVLAPAALAAWALVTPREGRWRRAGATALALVAAAAAGVALVAAVAPAVLHRPTSLAMPRADLFEWSAKWWSYLVPRADHPVLGPAVRALWARHGAGLDLLEHQQVGVGLSMLVLAAVPLWRWARGDRASPATRAAPALAVVALAAVVCSLSPERTIGPFVFRRPSALLYAVAPMFRAYARFGVAVGLMTAVLAGAGVVLLWRAGRRGRAAATLLLALAVFEYAPFPRWPSRDVLPTRAHRWLAAQPGALRVLDCVPPARVSDSLAAPLLGHEMTLLGAPPFDDCGAPGLADALAASGHTHVVARRGSPIAREGLAPAVAFDDAAVFRVVAGPPRPYVSEWIGFAPREYDGASTWRWMGRTGALRIAGHGAPAAILEVDLRAFPGDRRVAWEITGGPRGTIDVIAGWRRHALTLGPLPAGTATIALTCPGPLVVADDVLGNGDLRTPCLAVGNLRVLPPPAPGS